MLWHCMNPTTIDTFHSIIEAYKDHPFFGNYIAIHPSCLKLNKSLTASKKKYPTSAFTIEGRDTSTNDSGASATRKPRYWKIFEDLLMRKCEAHEKDFQIPDLEVRHFKLKSLGRLKNGDTICSLNQLFREIDSFILNYTVQPQTKPPLMPLAKMAKTYTHSNITKVIRMALIRLNASVPLITTSNLAPVSSTVALLPSESKFSSEVPVNFHNSYNNRLLANLNAGETSDSSQGTIAVDPSPVILKGRLDRDGHLLDLGFSQPKSKARSPKPAGRREFTTYKKPSPKGRRKSKLSPKPEIIDYSQTPLASPPSKLNRGVRVVNLTVPQSHEPNPLVSILKAPGSFEQELQNTTTADKKKTKSQARSVTWSEDLKTPKSAHFQATHDDDTMTSSTSSDDGVLSKSRRSKRRTRHRAIFIRPEFQTPQSIGTKRGRKHRTVYYDALESLEDTVYFDAVEEL